MSRSYKGDNYSKAKGSKGKKNLKNNQLLDLRTNELLEEANYEFRN